MLVRAPPAAGLAERLREPEPAAEEEGCEGQVERQQHQERDEQAAQPAAAGEGGEQSGKARSQQQRLGQEEAQMG
jgi:hypothetical protein